MRLSLCLINSPGATTATTRTTSPAAAINIQLRPPRMRCKPGEIAIATATPNIAVQSDTKYLRSKPVILSRRDGTRPSDPGEGLRDGQPLSLPSYGCLLSLLAIPVGSGGMAASQTTCAVSAPTKPPTAAPTGVRKAAETATTGIPMPITQKKTSADRGIGCRHCPVPFGDLPFLSQGG